MAAANAMVSFLGTSPRTPSLPGAEGAALARRGCVLEEVLEGAAHAAYPECGAHQADESIAVADLHAARHGYAALSIGLAS